MLLISLLETKTIKHNFIKGLFIMKNKTISIILSASVIFSVIPHVIYAAEYSDTELNIGDYVEIGTYAEEPIKWRCIDINENGALMLSDQVLCYKSYDACGWSIGDTHRNNIWRDSSIRCWLNSDAQGGNVSFACDILPDSPEVGSCSYSNEAGFLNGFTDEELELINPVYTDSYTDRVFLLDETQFDKMCSNINILGYEFIRSSCTQHAKNELFTSDARMFGDAWMFDDVPDFGDPYILTDTIKDSDCTGMYWLKDNVASPYSDPPLQAILCVASDGSKYSAGVYSDCNFGVRPALYLKEDISFLFGNGSSDTPYSADPDEIRVVVNGENLVFDQPPVMINDRVMVPIRVVAEAVGDSVKWSDKAKAALIIHNDRLVVFENQNNTVFIASEPEISSWDRYICDVPPQIVGDRTLTPVRAIGECLGAEVNWDGETRTVTINMPVSDGTMITEEFFNQFNVNYSLLLSDISFREFSPEINEFFESRDNWGREYIDAFIITWGDLNLGIRNILSNQSNDVFMIKNCLMEIFDEMSHGPWQKVYDYVDIRNKITLWAASAGSNLQYVNFAELAKYINVSAQTANSISELGNLLGEAGLYFSVADIATDVFGRLITDYTISVTCIDAIETALYNNNIDDENDAFLTALDELKTEYTNNVLGTLAESSIDGIIVFSEESISKVTGGSFSIAVFAINTLNWLAGNDDKAQALKDMYCIYDFNTKLDLAELTLKNDLYTEPDKLYDYVSVFELQRAVKIKMYEAMDVLRNKDDDNTKKIIDDQLKRIQDMSLNIWEYEDGEFADTTN